MRTLFVFFIVLAFLIRAQVAYAEMAPVYASPQEALDALVAGLETNDASAVIAALSPDAIDLVQSANPAKVAETMKELLAMYYEGYRFVPADDGVIIELGNDGWPFPVPIMRKTDGWSYDSAAARDEIRSRRIGANELEVIDVLEGYVALQSDYRQSDHDGDGVMEFAASIISTPDTRDGLYWPGDDSPIGDLAARANLDGWSDGGTDKEAEPFQGYYFRLLQEQGTSAPGGAMSYLSNGNMVGGHALLAVPAEYGVTGVHSFMVNEAGTIWEADLGPESLDTAFEFRSLDPGEEWVTLTD